MSNRKYFGTDGIRGQVGTYPITPDFVQKLGWAVGRALAAKGNSKVVIGKDTRLSGYMFESALESGLTAAGVDVHLLGPMPTPGIAYLCRTMRADVGIVISASHNPYYDNGIKFFSADGEKLDDALELAIEAELDKELNVMDPAKIGKVHRVDDARGRYIEYCKASIPNDMTLDGMKIVLDCAHGATYHIAPEVFTELGAEIIKIGCKPDGLNINKDVGSTHMGLLQKTVRETDANFGIAFDGDGDRVMLVDEAGEVVDGDEILYLIAKDMQNRNKLKKRGVVGTVMTNLGVEMALKEAGIPMIRSNVGDRYVMEALRENAWQLGAESSGHVICLRHTTTGDGVIAALQVVKAILNAKQPLTELRKAVTKLPHFMINVRYEAGKDPLESASVQDAIETAKAEFGDQGRVLIRKSGTEPVIRVMTEGTDAQQAEKLVNMLVSAVKDAC
jgi:phosphoglucosamine mutase